MTKSHLVRESIREYCARIVEERKRTTWEIYQSIHKAKGGSGHGHRVARNKEILKQKFQGMRKKWSS